MGEIIMSGIAQKLVKPSNLPPIGTALNDLTWKQVRAISDADVASNYFSVGDVKTIKINGKVGNTTFTNFSIDVFILGINHNVSREGTNRIHFSIGKKSSKDVCLCDSKCDATAGDGVSGDFIMNTSSSNSGGWASCHMRKTILGSNSNPTSPVSNTLLAALPSELRDVIKSVVKYSDNVGNGTVVAGNVTVTTDYLWLLAEYELYGAKSLANSAEQNYQKQYDYYKAGNSKVRYKHNSTSASVWWWLRSTRSSVSGYTEQFCLVSNTGSYSDSGARNSHGVTACFAV